MEYNVRPITNKDIPEYLALTQFTDSETDFLGSAADDPRPSPLQLIASLKNQRQVIFVAENDKGLIGHLGSFWRRGKNKKLGHCMNVGLAVAKDFWGHGIGTALMNAHEEWARQNGIVRLQLEVVTENERAVALYKKRGFAIEGTKQKSMKVGDSYKNEYLMAKILD